MNLLISQNPYKNGIVKNVKKIEKIYMGFKK